MTRSKKVLLIAPGSRGDLTPYAGLGVRLKAAGHHVVVCTHQEWKPLIEAHGMEFAALSGDSRAAQGSAEMMAWQESGNGAKSATKGVKMLTDVAADFRNQIGDIVSAARDVDVMLPSVLGGIGFLVAKGMNIPTMNAFICPTEPTGEFPPVGLGIGKSLGRLGNRSLYGMFNIIAKLAVRPAVREIISELGLPPKTKLRPDPKPDIYYGYSPEIVPPPKDWRSGIHTVGFWWLPALEQWTPPAELVDFLAAGPPPVSISFGSMAEGRGEELSEIAAQALRKAGARGVVQSGWARLSVNNDDILTVDGELDYNWLFPQLGAVVQHGGIGTTGCALRAGVPQVLVPMVADAHFWGNQVTKIGVSPGPVGYARITADALAEKIRAAVSDPSYRRRAEQVAARIAVEDGAKPVIDALNRLP